MTKFFLCRTALAIAATGFLVDAQAEPLSTLPAALSGGDVSADLRLRYEAAEQDNALKDADALTLRTLLGYRTQAWNDLSAFVEMENVSALIDDYSGMPPPVAYSLIPDPDGTETNQWGLSYSGIKGLTATVGRSKLIFDNARWVGNVGWRQNEQTYDGVFLKYSSQQAMTLQYAHLTNINSIFFANLDIDAQLFNAQWVASPLLALTGYAYLIDFENTTANTPDADTLGLRVSGGHRFGNGFGLSYVAEFASQEAETPLGEFDADYTLFELGASYKGIKLTIAQEVLGSDDGQYGLMTSLATLHAFNGWTDQFLFTPVTGLEDHFATLSGALGKFKWLAMYHDYQSDEGSLDYGSEWGAVLSRALGSGFLGGVKYGNYRAEDRSTDTEKLCVWLQWGF